MGYGKSLQLGPGTNSPSLLLPPWQGSLAVPEMRTGSCEVSSAKAKNINSPLITRLMGDVGLGKELFSTHGFYPKVAWCQGKDLLRILHWAGFQSVLMVEIKDQS